MGQKVNPKIFRIGVIRQPLSRWYAGSRNYRKYLEQDVHIRKWIKTKLKDGKVSDVIIERSGEVVKVNIHTSRPGVIIGRGGTGLEDTKKGLQKMLKNDVRIELNVQEIRKPDLDADIVLQSISDQLEKRVPFRRAMKRAIGQVMNAGALGVKISVAGRLNGADIARTEMLSEGKIPLHTLRADIDYSHNIAKTTFGVIGIKVWIYRGNIFGKQGGQIKQEDNRRNRRRPRPFADKRKGLPNKRTTK